MAELAGRDPKRKLHSIAHLITVEKIWTPFQSLSKNANGRVMAQERYKAIPGHHSLQQPQIAHFWSGTASTA
jgi:hypothetical protein